MPPLEFSDGALLKFSREMRVQLKDLEARFVVPRQHPRLFFGEARGASRRPR